MKLPTGVTTNIQLQRLAERMRIPFFRGVFMRNTLPASPWMNENAIINLDDIEGPGTHWVAYMKRGNRVIYFDSYGNLRPPKEFVDYIQKYVTQIEYNYSSHQRYNQNICGQLCLQFLQTFDNKFKH